MAFAKRIETRIKPIFVTAVRRQASIKVEEMSKRNLQPGELERIGKALLSQDAMSEAEIENIVNSPYLYSKVRNQVLSSASAPKRGIGLSRYLVFGGSSLAVVFSLFATVAFLKSDREQVASVEAPRVVVINSSPRPDSLSQANDKPLPPIDPLIQRVNGKRRISQQAQNISYNKPSVRTDRPMQTPQPELEFYPITYTGDLNETVRGGRVVRVEMSRASLFAMGINIPLENGAEVLKADLLIGPDGVTRAVRLAKDY